MGLIRGLLVAVGGVLAAVFALLKGALTTVGRLVRSLF